MYTVDENNSEESQSILEAQANDADIQRVKQWIEKDARPDFKDIGCESFYLKSLWSQWKRLTIQNEILVRRWDILETNKVVWQAIVPLKYRRQVLKYSHDIRAAGHLGIRKTLGKIRQRYYWPGLQNDVRNYVAGCEKCLKRKGPLQTKKAPMQVVRSGYPMERIAIDILGELPQTEKGNKYILVIADYFTKWTESFPMPNIEARTVAKILVEEVVCRFGIPDVIHSDQGKQFESRLFLEMCNLLQIQKTRTTPYHPQSDGMVERINKTLTTMLSMFVKDYQRDWDDHLPYVMMAYRSSEHETTGMTPNLLMFGREVSTPIDIAFEMSNSIKRIPTSQWVWELQETLQDAYSVVREYTGQSIRRQKRYHDTKLSFETFEKGDQVYVYFPVKKVGSSSKFTSFWRGPFQIISKESDVLYKVDCGRSNSFQIVHINRLRKARTQTLSNEDVIRNNDSQLTDSYKVLDISDESEAEQEPEQEIVTNRFGREIRKPKYLHDYVYSISRMANTKITTKQCPQVICPFCKENVAQAKYVKHLTECAGRRVSCRVCGVTFKKVAYARQHEKRKHGQVVSEGKSVEMKCQNEKVVEVDSDHEWDEDPNIVLDENNNDPGTSDIVLDDIDENDDDSECMEQDIADNIEAQCQNDTVEVSQKEYAPCIRKATKPLPVQAPVKNNKEIIKSSPNKEKVQISTREVETSNKKEDMNKRREDHDVSGGKQVYEDEVQEIICDDDKGHKTPSAARSYCDYDEYEIFGRHVALELRQVKSDKAKRLAKLKIQQALFEAQEAE